MITVNYDRKKNALTIMHGDKPQSGIIGNLSEAAYLRILEDEIAHLQKQKDNIDAWLYRSENIDKAEWMDNKRLANSIVIKIEQIKDRMDRKSQNYGMCELAISSDIKLNYR